MIYYRKQDETLGKPKSIGLDDYDYDFGYYFSDDLNFQKINDNG
jgi:hypothetical protein